MGSREIVYSIKQITCCYKCKDRKIGCHSTCQTYIKRRKELDKLNEEKYKTQLDLQSLNEAKKYAIRNSKNRRKQK